MKTITPTDNSLTDIKSDMYTPDDPATEPESPNPKPQENPEIEPEKMPGEDPGIQPGTRPDKNDDDDDDDDDPFTETEIGDDPDEIQKKTTIM